MDLGRYSAAYSTLQHALAEYGSSDRLDTALTLNDRGNVEMFQARYGDALKDDRAALAVFRDLGDRYDEAIALTSIGDVQVREHQFGAALESYQKALAIFRQIGAQADVARVASKLEHWHARIPGLSQIGRK